MLRDLNISKVFKAMLLCIAVLSSIAATPNQVRAEVLLAQDEALETAFGVGATTITKTALISPEQQAEIEERSQSQLPSTILHYFEGRRDGELLGYAVIDSRIMRTNLGVFMVVFSKELMVQKVVLLAFHEPSEYQPTNDWLDYLAGERPMRDLVPGQGLPPIAGSTLTTQGISDGVRCVRASLEVVLQGTK